MFLISDILLWAFVSAIITAAVLLAWKWARHRFRFAVVALTTFLGFTAWNVIQSSTGADFPLNIDWPIFPLSWADFGSGVSAFAVTAFVLGLITDRKEDSWKVVGAASIAGLLAMLIDLFVR